MIQPLGEVGYLAHLAFLDERRRASVPGRPRGERLAGRTPTVVAQLAAGVRAARSGRRLLSRGRAPAPAP